MIYKEWERFAGDKVVATSPLFERVFDLIPKGGRVLDLGCGNGRISKVLKDRGYQTYGMDVNASAIATAKANQDLVGIKFSVQDAKVTTYEDKFFDGVIEQAVLACMEKSDRAKVLTEVSRMLKSSGIFSIAEFGIKEELKERYENDAFVTHEYGTVIVKNEDGSESFRSHHFSKEELESLIRNSGFKVMQSAHPNFITRSGKEHPGHQYIVKKF